MVLELHVWGPAFGLPSIDPECIATIAYFNRIVPHAQWILVADYDTSISSRGTYKFSTLVFSSNSTVDEFPVLIDGIVSTTGFPAIVSYLRNHRSGAYDLDYHLTHQQQTDRTAFISFLQSTATPLVDLSLYVSSENYNSTASSAYTAILPWYLNYTIPPTRRDLARARTAHLGLSSLDVSTVEQDGPSDFEAAKRDAGIPTSNGIAQPKVLSMGRGKGIKGMLSSPLYAARFKLDALTNELLEPLSDLLGKKDYLLEGGKPSSLDCLAFGYLALVFYPAVPQAWLKEAMQTRYPRIVRYISRMREELLKSEDVRAADVWSISSCSRDGTEVQDILHKLGLRLPWRPLPPRSLYFQATSATREMATNLPLLSKFLKRDIVIQTSVSKDLRGVSSLLPSPLFINTLFALSATTVAALAGLAIHHRRSPRAGDLIFWASRQSMTGFGEAGSILSVLATQLPKAPAV